MKVIVHMKGKDPKEFDDVKGAQPSPDGQWFLLTENGNGNLTTVFNRNEMEFIEIQPDLIQVPPAPVLQLPSRG